MLRSYPLLFLAASNAQLDLYAHLSNTDFDPCTSPCIRVGNCGVGTNVTCNPQTLASFCDANPPCLTFNSNGWLKGCASSECGSAVHVLLGVDSWVKQSGFWPPVPVQPVEDFHYPPEEPSETAIYVAGLPTLVLAGSGWAILLQAGATQNVSVASFAFESYLLLWASEGGVEGVSSGAVIERTFSHWAATSLLHAGSSPTEAARWRRGVGRIWGLAAPSYANLTAGQPSYYMQAAWQPDDYLAQRIANASVDGEPNFTSAASYLPPQREYASIGAVNAPIKFSVSPDGRIKLASSALYTPGNARNASQPGVLIWDPAGHIPWPATNWSTTKSALVGGFLRVVATGGFDTTAALGMEQLAFAPANDPNGGLLVRLRSVNGSDPNHDDADTGPAHEYWQVSANGTATRKDDGALFYSSLFAESALWSAALATATAFVLPGPEGARQIDTLWGSVVAAASLYIGLQANYGDGIYWSPNSSLTSQVAPLDTLLNDVGLHAWSADRVSYNFAHFVNADGSLPECTPCDVQGGFGDALADYGEQLELFSSTAVAQLGYVANGSLWVSANLAPFIRLANFTLAMCVNASTHGAPLGDVTHGLVWGSPEHDTCREPQYYYHNSVWIARGLIAAGRFLNASGGAQFAEFSSLLLSAGAQLSADISASLNLSVGRSATDGHITWVPPVAALGTTPFNSMSESVFSSYTNFRYYAEMLNSGILPADVAVALMDFRESHGGTFAGSSRFEGHLDNMPSAGYTWSSLVFDRPAPFWQLLYGHMASYAAREKLCPLPHPSRFQNAFTPDALGVWRDYLWEYLEGGIAQCVPSLLLPAAATRWALVLEHKDEPVVWLARGAPRRWFAVVDAATTATTLSVSGAPTRFGTISFASRNVAGIDRSFNTTAGVAATVSLGEVVTMTVTFTPPPFDVPSSSIFTMVLRMRASVAGLSLITANITVTVGAKDSVILAAVDAASESVNISLTRAQSPASFVVDAVFSN